MPKNTPRKAKKKILKAIRIIILISSPDSDAITSGIVLKRFLKRSEKEVKLISAKKIHTPIPLFFTEEFDIKDPVKIDYQKYDLAVVLDTGNLYQLVDEKLYSSFSLPKNLLVVGIDHHLGNEEYTKINIYDPSASSVCELLYRYLLRNKPLSPKEATLLLLGISGDTGHLRWKTGPKTLKTVSELLKKKADLKFVINYLYFSHSTNLHKFLKFCFEKTRYEKDLGYIIVTVSEEEIKELGLSDVEYRNYRSIFCNRFLKGTLGYPVGFFVYQNGNKTSAAMRGNDYLNKIDLSKFPELITGAQGGGHSNSAGFTINAGLKETEEKIKRAMEKIRMEES